MPLSMKTIPMPAPTVTTLARDPTTEHRLNCNSFQQHALLTFANIQYATFYVSDTPDIPGSPRYVCIARRSLLPDPTHNTNTDPWHRIIFRDYTQTHEDGHNTISLGISPCDGRIHLVWDLHNDAVVNYRRSVPGLAANAKPAAWNVDAFGAIEDLALLVSANGLKNKEVTYPRFVTVINDQLLFECRLGRAGAGDAGLCRYIKDEETGEYAWQWMGIYLHGTHCSPYINGLHYDAPRNKLWATWTNRRFAEAQREADSSTVSQQAGPNGPENNEDLCAAWSGDGGWMWRAGDGVVVGELCEGGKVLDSRNRRVAARRIPRDSGILNQEGQCVDLEGRVHVLMRDCVNEGQEMRWKHHWKGADEAKWQCEEVPGAMPAIEKGVQYANLVPTIMGNRGKVCCDPTTGDIWFVIPGNMANSLTLLRRRRCVQKDSNDTVGEHSLEYTPFEMLWHSPGSATTGFDGEPLIDAGRLWKGDGRLSVMTRAVRGNGKYDVVVLDFDLPVVS